jgi:hypothetical protein
MAAARKSLLDAIGFIWDAPTALWEEGFAHLVSYRNSFGNCNVAREYKASDGYPLGKWVHSQRSYGKGRNGRRANRRIRTDCVTRLTNIGFIWDKYVLQWEEGFAHLESFRKENGHCVVPQSFKSADGFALGTWVNFQTTRQDQLEPERKRRLELLGFVFVLRKELRWEDGYQHLTTFINEHGHALVPQHYRSRDGFPLGMWVSNQRQRYRRNNITSEQMSRLVALKFVWHIFTAKWEEGFHYLKEFSKQMNHCGVPLRFKTDDGYGLGSWVSVQRRRRDKLDADRRKSLEALPGWIWKVEN